VRPRSWPRWDAEEETIASYDFTQPTAETAQQPFAVSPDPTLSVAQNRATVPDPAATPAGQPGDVGAGVFNYATADHRVEPTAKPKLETLRIDSDVADLLADLEAPAPPLQPLSAMPAATPASAPVVPSRAAPAMPTTPAASAAPSAAAPPTASSSAPIASDVEDLLAGLEERPIKYRMRTEPPVPQWPQPAVPSSPPSSPPEPAPDTEPLPDRPKPSRPAWAPPPGAVIDPSQGYTPATALPMTHRTHCSTCNADLEPGSRFCGECGTFQQSRIPACHLCGSPLEPSAKFCGECGSPRVDEAPPVPVTSGGAVPEMNSSEYRAYLASQEKPTQKNWMVKLLKFLED
jgi:hypothetical protein